MKVNYALASHHLGHHGHAATEVNAGISSGSAGQGSSLVGIPSADNSTNLRNITRPTNTTATPFS
jgi:hypothetical protein